MIASKKSVSSTRAFADLAAAIDRKVSSDRAADLLAKFRSVVRAETNASDAEIVRSFIPKGTDEESRAVAYALNLAANAVERGHR